MVRVFEGAVAKRILDTEFVKPCCEEEAPIIVAANDDGTGVFEYFSFCQLHKEDI